MNQPYDAGDPVAVKKAKKTRSILENRMKNGMAKIVADPDTRFVLASFLEQAKAFQDPFHRDPYQHAHNGGWRSAGLWWITQGLLHDPGFIGTLQADEDSPLKVKEHDGHSTSSDTSDE